MKHPENLYIKLGPPWWKKELRRRTQRIFNNFKTSKQEEEEIKKALRRSVLLERVKNWSIVLQNLSCVPPITQSKIEEKVRGRQWIMWMFMGSTKLKRLKIILSRRVPFAKREGIKLKKTLPQSRIFNLSSIDWKIKNFERASPSRKGTQCLKTRKRSSGGAASVHPNPKTNHWKGIQLFWKKLANNGKVKGHYRQQCRLRCLQFGLL